MGPVLYSSKTVLPLFLGNNQEKYHLMFMNPIALATGYLWDRSLNPLEDQSRVRYGGISAVSLAWSMSEKKKCSCFWRSFWQSSSESDALTSTCRSNRWMNGQLWLSLRSISPEDENLTEDWHYHRSFRSCIGSDLSSTIPPLAIRKAPPNVLVGWTRGLVEHFM